MWTIKNGIARRPTAHGEFVAPCPADVWIASQIENFDYSHTFFGDQFLDEYFIKMGEAEIIDGEFVAADVAHEIRQNWKWMRQHETSYRRN